MECLLVLKMVLTLKWFPVRLNFLEIPLTYGIMTAPSSTLSEEGWLLLSSFITESLNSCGYSLRIGSRLTFIISLLKSLHDLRSTAQAMNDSSAHTMWAVGFEVTITTCISFFLFSFFLPRYFHTWELAPALGA
jgi:hypothetical protein